jgi:hypothetical protein
MLLLTSLSARATLAETMHPAQQAWMNPKKELLMSNKFTLISEQRLDLVTGLSDSLEMTTKHPWSPFIFNNVKRQNTSFKETFYLVYDIDKNFTLNQALEQLPFTLIYYIGLTKNHQKIKHRGTKSEQPACDRFRIIIPLESKITDPEEFRNLWYGFKNKYGIIVDEQCKDLARFYYPTTTLVKSKGITLLNERYTASIPSRPVTTVLTAGRKEKGKLSRATQSFLLKGAAEGEWHGKFIMAAIDLKEQGYTEEEAALQLRKASPELKLDATDVTQLADVYKNRGGALQLRNQPFPVMMPPNKNGGWLPDKTAKENYIHLIQNKMNLTIRENLLTGRIEIGEEPLEDIHIINISLYAWENKLNRDKDAIFDICVGIAKENQYNPVKDFIESKSYDHSVDHIKLLFNTITVSSEEDAEALALYEIYVKKFFVGMIRKIYGLPWRGHGCLVFVGGQAMGKSRWLERIGNEVYPQGYLTSRINIDDKDSFIRLANKYLWVVEELDSITSNKEAGVVKDFLEKPDVTVRVPYARTSKDFKTITSFAAATNTASFLTDLSGNRRFWIIPTNNLDLTTKINFQQLFAQAYDLAINQGAEWYLNTSELLLANKINQRYINNSNLEALALELIESGSDALSLSEILELLEFGSSRGLSRSQRANISGILVSKKVLSKNYSGKVVFLVNKKRLTGNKKSAITYSTEQQQSKGLQ